jgi:hypothetical protein
MELLAVPVPTRLPASKPLPALMVAPLSNGFRMFQAKIVACPD